MRHALKDRILIALAVFTAASALGLPRAWAQELNGKPRVFDARPAARKAPPQEQDAVETHFSEAVKNAYPGAEVPLSSYYQTADQLVSQQVQYNLVLHELIEKEKDENKIRTALGPACPAGVSITDCKAQYETAFQRMLVLSRAALAGNKRSAAELADGGHSPRIDVAPESAKPLVLNSLVLALEDLAKFYPKDQAAADEYHRWRAALPAAPPTREDFVQFEEIPRYPGTRSAETIRRVKKDPNGNPVIDETSFRKAEALFKNKIAHAPVNPFSPLKKFEQLRKEQGLATRAYQMAAYSIVEQVNLEVAPGSAPKRAGGSKDTGTGAAVDADLKPGSVAYLENVDPAALESARVKPIPEGSKAGIVSFTMSERELDKRIADYLP